MKTILATLFALAAVLLGPAHADEVKRERVKFQSGASEATLKSRIKGYTSHEYVLGAKAGQVMTIRFKTDNGSAYFNVMPPTGDTALYVGSSGDPDRFTGTLPADGDYVVQVYLMRNAARRDEVANYTITIGIGAAAQDNASSDALVPGTNYNATGRIPCTLDGQPDVKDCEFGVTRGAPGVATVFITVPNGFVRVLGFDNGKVAPQSAVTGFSSRRDQDSTIVQVNGQDELYVIPDAVIFGG